jgi:RimJ/RimL family protein N-acetyltransferase
MRHRLITIDDAKVLTEYRNQHRECFFDNSILTVEQTVEWIKRQENDPCDMTFIIEDDEQGHGLMSPVGQFAVYNIRQEEGAECGRVIKYRAGSWIFESECIHILKEVATLYKLKRITAEVKAENKRSLLFFARLGFQVESECWTAGKITKYFLMRKM